MPNHQRNCDIMFSGNDKIPQAKLCLMKLKTVRLLCVIGGVSLVMAIIVIAVTVTANNQEEKEQLTVCQFGFHLSDQDTVDTRSSNSLCNSTLPFVQGCSATAPLSWSLHTKNLPSWNQVKDNLTVAKIQNVSTILVSPLYKIGPNSCAINIALRLWPNSTFQLFVHSSQEQYFFVNDVNTMSDDECQNLIINDKNQLSQITTNFRLVLLTNSSINDFDMIKGSVISKRCIDFLPIKYNPVATTEPTFTKVSLGNQDSCSVEFINRQVDCEWWQVQSLSDETFDIKNDHSCVGRSAPTNEVENPMWYLLLTNVQPGSRSYFISPIIDGNSTDLLISFDYIALCVKLSARVYVIPSFNYVYEIELGTIDPVHTISSLTETTEEHFYDWINYSMELTLYEGYDNYQIVIEFQIEERRENCSYFFCKTAKTENETGPYLFAIDEIFLSTRNEKCSNLGNGENISLDCSFQDENGTKTMCLWESSLPRGITYVLPDFFHWKIIDAPLNMDDNGHGVFTEHFEGRGFIVSQEGTQNGNYIRTPELISENACTCRMNFLYLLRGIFTPRIQVNIVSAGNSTSLTTTQWSVDGRQTTENWTKASILINLPSTYPFQIELTATDHNDHKAQANIDDISFIGCDLPNYAQRRKLTYLCVPAVTLCRLLLLELHLILVGIVYMLSHFK